MATLPPRIERPPRWHAVDPSGPDLAGGCAPSSGPSSAAAALAAAPALSWPIALRADDGSHVGLAGALGPGGDGVEAMLTRLLAPASAADDLDIGALAADTPLGPVTLPLALVPLADGVERSASVDPEWLAALDARRSAPRPALVHAGREVHLEAALHVTMLLATERLAPVGIDDVDERVASGAQLWLLAGAVAWALLGRAVNPFAAWVELVTAGLWPIGPIRGHLVVVATRRTG